MHDDSLNSHWASHKQDLCYPMLPLCWLLAQICLDQNMSMGAQSESKMGMGTNPLKSKHDHGHLAGIVIGDVH